MERKLILKINGNEYSLHFKVCMSKIKILSIGKRFKPNGNIYEPIKFEVLENRRSTAIDYLWHFWIMCKIYISELLKSKRTRR